MQIAALSEGAELGAHKGPRSSLCYWLGLEHSFRKRKYALEGARSIVLSLYGVTGIAILSARSCRIALRTLLFLRWLLGL